MIYTIKKNNHYSGIHFCINLDKKVMQRYVMFSENCKYVFDDIDRFDINKLFGFSEGLHHKNSARFGWLYNPNTDKFEIHAYVYADGQLNLTNTYICSVFSGSVTNLLINVVDDHYEFGVITGGVNKNVYRKKVPRGKSTTKLGYNLYPYFGGNKTAPHEMDIQITKENV